MKVLGLDVSTSNVGICLMDSKGPQDVRNLLAIAVPMSKVKGLYAKSCVIQDVLHDVSRQHKVDLIVIEESLQAFRSRMSSAKTISTLNRFNGIVSFISRSIFDVPVCLGNVISVRKAVGISIDKKSDLNTKEQVLHWTKQRPEMLEFDWPTKILKSGPRKGEKIDEPFCFDIADAFVMALWGCTQLKIEDIDTTIL